MPRTLCTRPRSKTVWYCDDGASSFLTCVQTFPERAWDWMRGASPYLCASGSGPPCWASSRAATSAAFLALSAAFSASLAACVSGDGSGGSGMSATGFGLFVGVRGDGKVPELFRLGREEFADAAAGGRAGAWTAVRSCESGNTAGVCSATSRGVTRDDRRVARRPRGPGSRADSAGDDQGLEIHRSRSYLLGTLLGLALGAALGGGLGGHRGRGVLGDGRLNLGRRGFGHLLSLVAYRARRCGVTVNDGEPPSSPMKNTRDKPDLLTIIKPRRARQPV